MKAFFIGRMQPFHNGHFKVLNQLLNNNELIIGIGCPADYSQANRQLYPFFYKEVRQMIYESLAGDYQIIRVNNNESNDVWVQQIIDCIGSDYTLYTGNELVKQIFSGVGIKVIDLDRWEGISATLVRSLIYQGNESWKELVPKGTIKVLYEVNGLKRLKLLT